MRTLVDRRLRSNPSLSAVALHDLPADDRAAIEAAAGGNFWAVLRHCDTAVHDIGIDHETAVIFHALREPLMMRDVVAPLPMARRERAVARLVCDQILQIELPDSSFVDGVAAHHVLFEEDAPDERRHPSRQIDPLSKAALDHAIAVRSVSSAALTRRLYMFNTAPRTRQWDGLTGGNVANWLGIASGSGWLERMSRRYGVYGSTAGETPWLQWTRKDSDARVDPRYKIYVSPVSAQLPGALPIVAELCGALDVPAFKVGATLQDVLRPDKLVVYLNDEQALWHVAEELRTALSGFEAHGVPFTAPIDSAGLLSWGVDPKEAPMTKHAGSAPSWRSHIAMCLGETLARTKGRADDAVVLDFALERLRLDGVEPVGWRPGEGGFSQ